MSYSVHTKPLATLEWADILDLKEQGAEESATLEFKSARLWDEIKGDRERKKDIAKEIVAFANAYGGVLIIGVEETDRGSGVAGEIVAIEDAARKMAALERSMASLIDPPIAGIGWRMVPEPESDGRGAIVVSIPPSQLAPHGFDKPPLAYVRRFTSSDPMTMRDIHNVFWEARTRQERVKQIRSHSIDRLRALRDKRDRGVLERTSGAPGERVTADQKGAFVRCSAIFQEPLGATFEVLEQIAFPRGGANIGTGAYVPFSPNGQRRAIVDGIALDGQYASRWTTVRDGTIDCAGFQASHGDRGNVHAPESYAALATLVAVGAHRLRKAVGRPDAPFELDLTFLLDEPAFGWRENVWAHESYPKAAPEFRVGPYLVASTADLSAALKASNVDIHRGFGLDTSEPIGQTFDFIERL